MTYSRSQSGSVASFVVVAIVLIGLITGAVFFARHRGSEADTAKQVEVAKQDKPTAEGHDTKQNEEKTETSTDDAAKKKAESDAKKKINASKDKKEDEKSSQKASEKSKKSTDKKQQKTERKEEAKQEKTPQPQENSSHSTPMERDTTEHTGSAALPTTGPAEDMLAGVIGIIAITGAGYVYYHFGRK